MPSITPVRPAIKNWKRNPMQKSIGGSKRSLPPYIVASQLKILIPVGTATRKVEVAKKIFPIEVMMKAIIVVAATIIGYPKMGLREKTGMISERQAKAGMIRM